MSNEFGVQKDTCMP